ncbi:hypothetical protein LUZ60_009107 [Juncus effusus]|nr:hypothetical protein LUZ60_009107 [Juncus effusus]
MASKLSKVQKRSLVELDLISNLPEDVRQKILTYLPIEEAGRTSILSRKWRYIWASIPELKVFSGSSSNLVDTILLLHNGPILKFDLIAQNSFHEAFDRWIINLSRNGIRELTFNIDSSNANYMMHSKLFSCDELNSIYLNNCSLKVPDEFKGFKLLHTLRLIRLKISEGEIEKLISSCPLLKKLTLLYSVSNCTLSIDAPNLLTLFMYGTFTHLKLCAPKLRSLHLFLEDNPEHNMSKNLERVIGNLPVLESLHIHGFLEYLCVEPLRERLSLTFNHLKCLIIVLNFETEKESAFALSLFQGAPHLESLHVDVDSDERSTLKFWETVDRKENLFKHLQTVMLRYFIVSNNILTFIKFILESAPQLLSLTVEEDPEYEEDDRTIVLKQLLLFRRASPNAQIIFK